MVNPIYPTRSFIRFQAKRQLTADMSGQQVMTFVSRDSLDNRMDVTLPNPSSHPPASNPSGSNSTADLYPSFPQSVPEQFDNAQVNNDDQVDHHDPVAKNPPSVQVDEVLFKDVVRLAFHPKQHPEIYRPCESPEQAAAIEQAIATEIVDSYKRIQSNRTKPSIQALNALL